MESVTLTIDGRQVTVVIEKLSDGDRNFLNRLADVGSVRDGQMLKEIGIERRAALRETE